MAPQPWVVRRTVKETPDTFTLTLVPSNGDSARFLNDIELSGIGNEGKGNHQRYHYLRDCARHESFLIGAG